MLLGYSSQEKMIFLAGLKWFGVVHDKGCFQEIIVWLNINIYIYTRQPGGVVGADVKLWPVYLYVKKKTQKTHIYLYEM